MRVAITLVVWVTIGVAVGLFEARRGHWSRLAVLTGILGPFAVPLALGWHRRGHSVAPRTVVEGKRGSGEIDVVIGIDGSPESLAAARAATDLFGTRLGRVAVACVIDIESAEHDEGSELYPKPWEEEQAARGYLAAAAHAIEGRLGARPDGVLLAGNPAEALESYALEGAYDFVIVGPRGRGLSKLVFGSCASRLAERGRVPVLFFTAATKSALGEQVGAEPA